MRPPLAALTLPIALALVPATARADVGGTIFTIAGARATHAIADGERATSADFDGFAPVAVLPDGDVLVGSDEMVWRIHEGVVTRVAGTGDVGTAGDGGPALDAELWVDDLAALPGGGYLIADGEDGRIRMVDPQGTITTVAGGGLLRGEGVPAREAHIDLSFQVAADPAGGFVLIEDENRIRRVTPDGRIFTVAGTGRTTDRIPDLHGQPATSVSLSAFDVAAAADGSVLIADEAGRVDRVAPDGAITAAHEDAPRLTPTAVAAEPGGGFVLVDESSGPSARVWRAGADGSPTPLAGNGRLQLTAPAGLAQRLDGAPAARAVLNDPQDIAVAPDGGVVITDSIQDGDDYGTLVRYIAPPSPGRLAVALQRDRRRVLGSRTTVGVALTKPATVALTVAGRTRTAVLPSGSSRMALPGGLPRGRPLTVHLAATGAGGVRAYDRARVYPRRWLPTEVARLVTGGLHRRAIVEDCRRFGALRVDCRQDIHSTTKCATTSVRLAAAGLRWGRYGCRLAAHPRFRRRPHALARREWSCVPDASDCPPAIFGRVREADLLPSD